MVDRVFRADDVGLKVAEVGIFPVTQNSDESEGKRSRSLARRFMQKAAAIVPTDWRCLPSEPDTTFLE